jgi:hypothetical protein
MTDQCDGLWDTLRCQLVHGHQSAHASRVGTTLHSWKGNVSAEFADRLVLDWAEDAE